MSVLDNILKRYGYINEADDDNGEDTGANDTTDTSTTNNTDTASDNTGDNDTPDSNNNADDDDIDIDTNLDDNDDTSDDGNNDQGTDSGDIDTGEDDMGSSDNTTDEEPVPQNKEVFDTLTAEEQAIKIKELKNLYFNMYSSINDIAKKLDELDTDDDCVIAVSRISGFIYDLKDAIHQYLLTSYDNKSYIENDFMYNRFLALIHSITNSIDELVKIEKRKYNEEEINKK